MKTAFEVDDLTLGIFLKELPEEDLFVWLYPLVRAWAQRFYLGEIKGEGGTSLP